MTAAPTSYSGAPVRIWWESAADWKGQAKWGVKKIEDLHEEADHDAEAGIQVQEVTWDMGKKCFLCRMLDDADAPGDFADDVEGLRQSYAARGWAVFDDGPIARVFISGQSA
jgi:hypothetical protein